MSSAKLPAPHYAGQCLAGEIRKALATYPAANDQERCHFYASFIASVLGQLIDEVGIDNATIAMRAIAETTFEADIQQPTH
ncbi:hypothetical protein [Chromobacterium phragmitis]|uniref:Uncharacterized protein n=1 Tax=Chromobacterium phragmitis TaxID=2202141 RepID=A0A344UPF9_9NEIS|nr:hypothetical protein [Chromobacterium phragmitis]AXE37157.1 hypothetical protein DK843_22670 [Chromobacterium phragmitis]